MTTRYAFTPVCGGIRDIKVRITSSFCVLVESVTTRYGPICVRIVFSIHGIAARHVTSSLRSTAADHQTPPLEFLSGTHLPQSTPIELVSPPLRDRAITIS